MRAEIFGYQLTPGQLKIVGSVLDPQVKRLSVCAMTRYGKTLSVAIALLLIILWQRTEKPKRILLLSPTKDQTAILRNYISTIISNTPELAAIVDIPKHGDPEHLKKEVSRKRITFTTGWELITLTAYGTGAQLMGFGGDIIVPDEACLISDEVYTSRISRMLGDNPDSKLIELVNPWHRLNFAYRHWQNPAFKHIHIDWRQALREGRTTETFIQEQRAELSDYEFTVLYESKFPTEAEDTLISWAWIQRAPDNQPRLDDSIMWKVWGLDVGEQGPDLTVLTEALTDGVSYIAKRQFVIDEKDTMHTVAKVVAVVPKNEQINVDSIGVGAGVYSRLKELDYNVQSVRVSEKPTIQPERYLNLKAQKYWQLRTVYENRQLRDETASKTMQRQLSQMRYEFTSAGKIRIIDPEGKSPDFADSLMLCMVEPSSEPIIVY